MEYEKAYVFQPDRNGRAAKRRRVEPQGLHASWPQRRLAYRAAWKQQQAAIDARLASVNGATLDEISEHLDETVDKPRDGKIPSAIVLTGAGGSARTTIADQLNRRHVSTGKNRRVFVSLSSNVGSNLKAVLKALILRATQRPNTLDEGDDEIAEASTGPRKGPRLLNYDLQLLYAYILDHKIQQVIVSFEDTEAFDGDLLSEVIELLGCWHNRIPFVFLINIATSVDFLQHRLSKAAIRCLDGKLFNAAPSGEEVEQVLEALINSNAPLWMGSSVVDTLIERQNDYIQSIGTLIDEIQYAYMSAYFANPLTLCLTRFHVLPHDHCEALRRLDSFQQFAEKMLHGSQLLRLQDCMDSDEKLGAVAAYEIGEGRHQLKEMMVTLAVIRSLQQQLPNNEASSWSSLYIQAMAGKLLGSPMLRALLLTIRKMSSDIMIRLLGAVLSVKTGDVHLPSEFQRLLKELNDLLESDAKSGEPLRSEDDIRNSTLRTTVVAQKVELSKHKSALSERDKKYTELLGRFSKALESLFSHTLIDPKDVPFHEIFIYDLKSPHREVFMPKPRHAIERALATPHDYLDCDCCAAERGGAVAEDADGFSATQPATAVLYQLYLESGSLINASDLWQAFRAVMDGERNEEQTVALFQRGLAELKYLGMLKPTRKRVDHVAKVMWRGL